MIGGKSRNHIDDPEESADPLSIVSRDGPVSVEMSMTSAVIAVLQSQPGGDCIGSHRSFGTVDTIATEPRSTHIYLVRVGNFLGHFLAFFELMLEDAHGCN